MQEIFNTGDDAKKYFDTMAMRLGCAPHGVNSRYSPCSKDKIIQYVMDDPRSCERMLDGLEVEAVAGVVALLGTAAETRQIRQPKGAYT